MNDVASRHIDAKRSSRRGLRQYVLAFVACALLVVAGVNVWLHGTGISMTSSDPEISLASVDAGATAMPTKTFQGGIAAQSTTSDYTIISSISDVSELNGKTVVIANTNGKTSILEATEVVDRATNYKEPTDTSTAKTDSTAMKGIINSSAGSTTLTGITAADEWLFTQISGNQFTIQSVSTNKYLSVGSTAAKVNASGASPISEISLSDSAVTVYVTIVNSNLFYISSADTSASDEYYLNATTRTARDTTDAESEISGAYTFIGFQGTGANSQQTLYVKSGTSAPKAYFCGDLQAPTNGNKYGTYSYTTKADGELEATVYQDDNGYYVLLPQLGSTTSAENNTIAAPSTFDGKWTLQGWADVSTINSSNTYNYYGSSQFGNKVYITQDTYFYADWQANSYAWDGDTTSLGGLISSTAPTDESAITSDTIYVKDTSSWITTNVFDYNSLYNLYRGQLSKANASTVYGWSVADNNTGLLFYDTNTNDICTIMNLNGTNATSGVTGGADVPNKYQANAYQGLMSTIGSVITADLFSTNSTALGVNYVGSGKNLYYYYPSTGFYEYDSSQHAASYDSETQSFKLYNETQSVENKDGSLSTAFLPFNDESSTLSAYEGEVDYWFGIDSEIRFNLPAAVGTTEAQTQNVTEQGTQMVFEFSGDDDVWVYIDDELVLDIGGIHGALTGSINFVTGEWYVNPTTDTNTNATTYQSSGTLDSATTGAAGTHTLKILYMERGASASNAKIRFALSTLGSIDVSKSDKDDPSIMLENTEFVLRNNVTGSTDYGKYYSKDASGTVTWVSGKTNATSVSTDATGVASFTDLPYGNYVLEEVASTTHYSILKGEIEFSIDSAGKSTVVSVPEGYEDYVKIGEGSIGLIISNAHVAQSIGFTKYGMPEATGGTAETMAGAIFNIYLDTAFNDDGTLKDGAKPVATKTTDENGNFTYDGFLSEHTYYLVESSAASGFGTIPGRIKVQVNDTVDSTGAVSDTNTTIWYVNAANTETQLVTTPSAAEATAAGTTNTGTIDPYITGSATATTTTTATETTTTKTMSVSLYDPRAYELPATGGFSPYVYTAAGAALLLAAFAFYRLRQRRFRDEKGGKKADRLL